MSIRPSRPEIITVNSESLQTQIRDLLPSQNGFGSELQASNVIQPIIDLTSAAEGSTLPSELTNAIAFGSQTAFNVSNTATTIVSTTGFYRIFGSVSGNGVSSGQFSLTDGVTTKLIFATNCVLAGVYSQIPFDFIVFCAAGESVIATSINTSSFVIGSVRQIATGSGTLVNPNGFPL